MSEFINYDSLKKKLTEFFIKYITTTDNIEDIIDDILDIIKKCEV